MAPDIRYLAGISRAQTHLSREQLEAFLAQYPGLNSFILGFRVHCLLDELDLSRIIGVKFPLKLVRRRLSSRKTAVLVELYYQETVHFCPQIQGTHNALLGDLGIRPDHWVIPSAVFPQQNASAKYWVKQKLRGIVLASETPEPRILALFTLLHTCGLLNLLFTKDERRSASSRAVS